MEITGSHAIDQSPEAIWTYLNDPAVLARITPGLTELESQGNDDFKAISVIRIGPVKAQFDGQLQMKDKVENESMTVAIQQDSKIGNVRAEIGMKLVQENDNTVINYTGEAKLVGKIASMGQRIVGGVVASMSKQFFVNLENEFKK